MFDLHMSGPHTVLWRRMWCPMWGRHAAGDSLVVWPLDPDCGRFAALRQTTRWPSADSRAAARTVALKARHVSELAARWPAFLDALHSALDPDRPLSRRPSGSRPAGGSGPGSVPSGRCILRRHAVHYGLGVMAPNRPSCSPFGPAVKKTVLGPKLALLLTSLPTRRLHSPSMTIACP
jgi:hypothetical protein